MVFKAELEQAIDQRETETLRVLPLVGVCKKVFGLKESEKINKLVKKGSTEICLYTEQGLEIFLQ